MKTLLKRRVLVTRFPYSSQWGGEEIHTVRLMEELDKRGIEAFFLGSCPQLLRAFKDKGFVAKKAWLGKPPVTFARLLIFTMLSPVLFLQAGLLLGRAHKKWAVDALYALSLGEKLLITPWARLFNMKILWLEHARIGAWLTKNPWRHLYRFLSGFADIVVTSKAMIGEVAPFTKNAPIAISCGVIKDAPEPLSKELIHFLGKGTDELGQRIFAVGCVSRLSTDKGVDILVHLVQSKPEIRLIIVGQGPLRGELASRIDPERIRLVPSLPRGQLMSFYKHLDLFILPSRLMDPFGMVAAEAMSEGIPTLMTDVCGIAKDLRDGQEAFIVPPKSSELDKALKKIMRQTELRKKVGEQGKAFVQKHYRLETMVSSFERLLTI